MSCVRLISIASSMLSPLSSHKERWCAHICRFVHACNPPISKVPPGFPQLPVITQSNLQFSSTPSTLKCGNLEFWRYSWISVISPQEDNQATSSALFSMWSCAAVEIRQMPEVGSFQNDQMHNSDFCTAQPLILSHGLRPLGLLHHFTR